MKKLLLIICSFLLVMNALVIASNTNSINETKQKNPTKETEKPSGKRAYL